MLGIASSAASREATRLAGLAGLVAGSMSMAVGEYVSVSSQRDAERADSRLEAKELHLHPKAELRELAQIYVSRGVEAGLALRVAEQLSARDRLGAHLRDELGIEAGSRARPLRAAAVSAASFASFATIPILALVAAPAALHLVAIAGASLLGLALLGALGAYLGGAGPGLGAARVALGGALAMGITATTGHLLGLAFH